MSTLERESRRPGWRRGRAIVLPSGDTFWLPVLRPEHAHRLPKLAAHLRSIADGSSFCYAGDESPGCLDRTVDFMRGLVAECLSLNYDIQPDDLGRLMRGATVAERDGRLLDCIRGVLGAAREGGLSRALLAEVPA